MAEPDLHWSRDPSWMLYAPLIGGGLGAGARLIKHLLDQRKARVKPLRTSETQLPVEVTPEEALTLESQGQDVKTAEVNKVAILESVFGGPTTSATGGAIRGALGTGAAIGGYALIDSLIDRARKKQLKQDIEHLRGRLSDVLEDRPAQEDIPLHAQMKAAEDLYFEKKAGMVMNAIDANLPAWLAAAAGGAGVLSGLASFRRVKEENPNSQRISDLRALLRPAEGPSKITLTPVVNKLKMLALLKAKQEPREVQAESVDRPKIDWGNRLKLLHARRGEDMNGVPLIHKKKPEAEPAASPATEAEQSLAI